MKRALSGLLLLVLTAVSTAAAADQVGVVGSFQTGALMFGGQYQQDNGVRFGWATGICCRWPRIRRWGPTCPT